MMECCRTRTRDGVSTNQRHRVDDVSPERAVTGLTPG